MKIPYQLVSMAAILRDYADMSKWYKDDTHEKLVDIADSLYNAGIRPEDFLPEYKELYDQYGEKFWGLVRKDMSAIDSQLTTDDKVQELADDYVDRFKNINASTKVTAADYNPHLIKVSPEDKKYILDRLNRSSKTSDEFDNSYYKFDFMPTYSGSGLWSSDAGLDILDESGIEYELVQKNIDSATNVTASYSEDYYDFDDFVMDLGDRLAERKISRADADREIKKFCRDHRTCDYRTLHNIVYENASGKVEAENDRLRNRIKDMRNKSVKASDNPFYDKLSAKDKRFVDQTKKAVGVITLKGKVGKYDTTLTIDMWYGDKFVPKKYGADAQYYGNDGEYRGNIYDETGKAIGDYTSDDSSLISKNFQIDWGD